MSEKKAMDMTKQLALMGQSAGISAGKMTKDFQAAFKSLAVYGEKSIEVFQGLSSAARAACSFAILCLAYRSPIAAAISAITKMKIRSEKAPLEPPLCSQKSP